MVIVIEPLWVSTPAASNARMLTVRFEPAGTVTVPRATPLTTGMLNTSAVGMSGAVTSTTTVATDVLETSARMLSVASPPVGPIPFGLQETHATTHARAMDAERNHVRDMTCDLRQGRIPKGGNSYAAPAP